MISANLAQNRVRLIHEVDLYTDIYGGRYIHNKFSRVRGAFQDLEDLEIYLYSVFWGNNQGGAAQKPGYTLTKVHIDMYVE